MAKPTKNEQELKEAIAQAEKARVRLTSTGSKVSNKLNVVGQAKGDVKKDPITWVGGSALIGLIASYILKPKKKRIKAPAHANRLAAPPRSAGGFIWKMLVMIVRLAKPAAKIYLGKVAKDYIQKKSSYAVPARPRRARIVENG